MKNVLQLLKEIKRYKSQIFLYLLCSLLAVVFSLFSFTMLAPVLQLLFIGEQTLPTSNGGLLLKLTELVNTLILEQGRFAALGYVILFVVLFTLFKNLFLYLSYLVLNPIRNGVIRDLRDRIFGKVISLPIGYFTEEKKGDLISRMTNDINEVEVSIMSVLQTIIREPITIFVTLGYMVYISPRLTLFLLLFLPAVGFVIGKVGSSLKRPSGEAQNKLGVILGIIDETLSGMRILKAFNAERIQWLNFKKENNQLYRIQNKILARRDAGSPLSESLGITVVGIILLYGGWLIFSNADSGLTGPWFIAYIGLFYQIINPVKNLSTAFYNMEKGAAALERVYAVLDTENTIVEKDNAQDVEEFRQELEFRKVSFAYESRKVLDNVSFKLEKGKTIAIVGASGSGKSTLVDLIARFHDVSSGAILLDGVDIRDLKVYELRRLIGMVTQEPILFNDTIFNNISLGVGNVTEEEVVTAAKIANAHEFIIQKPESYQTSVGDRGLKLSGGQRQRITIARAILKNPPILILDEATSALDTESEMLVQKAIEELMKNRTSIVIAHRLSTIRNVDEILVLDQGRIAERGNHDFLMSQAGIYKHLVDLQQIK